MPNFSIVNIDSYSTPKPGLVNGSWTQDHSGGTLETAIEVARATSKVNSNHAFAVVRDLGPNQFGRGVMHDLTPFAICTGDEISYPE